VKPVKSIPTVEGRSTINELLNLLEAKLSTLNLLAEQIKKNLIPSSAKEVAKDSESSHDDALTRLQYLERNQGRVVDLLEEIIQGIGER
jgi:response regulator of citrate/malate metabolism